MARHSSMPEGTEQKLIELVTGVFLLIYHLTGRNTYMRVPQNLAPSF